MDLYHHDYRKATRKNSETSFLSVQIRFRLDTRKKFFCSKGGETLERVAQTGSGGPIPGNIQGQVGRGSKQPGLVEDVLLTGLDDL